MTRTATSPLRNEYFPSSKVYLIIRLDEFGDPSVAAQAPPKPINVVRGTGTQIAPLAVQKVTVQPSVDESANLVDQGQQILASRGATINKLQLVSKTSKTPPGGPQAQTGSADGYTHVIVAIPKRASWSQNGIRAGDTLNLTVRYADLPIDPRVVRSCAVEWYFGTVSQDDYARGAEGQTRTTQFGSATFSQPLNLIPDSYVDDDGQQRTNMRFQGFVDGDKGWEVVFDEDDEPVVNLECTDNTHLLINIESPAGLTISTTLPIDQAIANYLANFPTMNGLFVEYRPSQKPANWPDDLSFPPTLGQALAGTAYQPHLGPAPSKGGGATQKLTVWDYLTDVAGALGHNVYVDGVTVVVTQVQTLLSTPGVQQTPPRRVDDPFQGRTVDGHDFPYRQLLWGRNLGRMTLRRNFGKKLPTNVEVRCFSPRRKKDLVVRFPDPTTDAGKKLLAVTAQPGDGATEQKWLVWKVRGIENMSILRLIAQNIYQSIGRMQFELELETVNLASFGGATMDPDILDVRSGDTVEVLLVQDTRDEPSGTTTLAQELALFSSASQEFLALGAAPEFAAAYERAFTNAGFTTYFRLRTMGLDWDADSDDEPVKITLGLVNFVEVRAGTPFDPNAGA